MLRRPHNPVPGSLVQNPERGSSSTDQRNRNRVVRNQSGVLNRILSRLSKPTISRQLTELIDPEAAFQQFREHGLLRIPTNRLFAKNWDQDVKTRFLKNHVIQAISCLQGQVVILPLYGEETNQEALSSISTYVHPGLIAIGCLNLGMQNMGRKALIVIRDTREQSPEKSTIASLEMDLTENAALGFISPKFVMNFKEAKQYLKIFIKTRAYEEMTTGLNLKVFIGYISRVGNTTLMNYCVEEEKITEVMTGVGIRMIPPVKIDPSKDDGKLWDVSDIYQ